jgi:hypothetical protein
MEIPFADDDLLAARGESLGARRRISHATKRASQLGPRTPSITTRKARRTVTASTYSGVIVIGIAARVGPHLLTRVAARIVIVVGPP